MRTTRPETVWRGPARQRGAATLILTLVILAGLTAVTFYAAETAVTRQRITANELRAREASEAASLAIENTVSYLRANKALVASSGTGGWVNTTAGVRWTECGSSDVFPPCGNGTTAYYKPQCLDPSDTVSGNTCSTSGNPAIRFVYYHDPGTTCSGTAWGQGNCVALEDGEATPWLSKRPSAFSTPAEGDQPREVYIVARCADNVNNTNTDVEIPDGVCDDLNSSTAGTQVGPSVRDDSMFTIVARGFSADQTGSATMQQSISLYQITAGSPDAPLVAASSIDLAGSIELVTNPNGGGEGVPLSVWSKSVVTIGSSAVTCQLGEYLNSSGLTQQQLLDAADEDTGIILCPASGGNSCSCSGAQEIGQISNNTLGEGPDIVDSVVDFPDLFEYTFGRPRSEWEEIRDEATIIPSDVYADCSELSASSSGLIWVDEGEGCDISNNATIGSPLNPVLLVVDEGLLKINGGATVYGLLFVFDKDEDEEEAETKSNGTVLIYGSIIAEGPAEITNGTAIVRYDETVLKNVSLTGGGRGVGKLSGTWADFF